MPIHEKIRLLRQVKGLTQEEVADKLNLSVNGYGKIERGECDVNLTRLEQLAGVFGIEPTELLGMADKNVFNLSCSSSCTNYCTNTIEMHNTYTNTQSVESNPEIEKLQLILQIKDKEIELRDEKIHHLSEVLELLKSKDSL